MENMEIKQFYKGKKVLVTGHTGFKGAWLTQILLKLGAEVCGVALKPEDNTLFKLLQIEENIINKYVDVRDWKKVKDIFEQFQPKVVFHLAAQPLVLEGYNHPRETFDVNIMGTTNICEAIRKTSSVKSFINITTDKVYKNIEQAGYRYREEDELFGEDPYSNSKSCSELITESYKKSFFNNLKIAVSTCRAGNVIGGGDFAENRIIPDLVKALSMGKNIELRNPSSVRPYQHVLDAVFFYVLLGYKQTLNPQLAGNYNIGPDKEDILQTQDLARKFYQKWGKDFDFSLQKKDCSKVEANYLELNTDKIKAILGWNPLFSIEKAIEKTVEWYKVYLSDPKEVKKITNMQIEEIL